MPDARCAPAAWRAVEKKHTSKSPQVSPAIRHSLHNGFNGFLRALSGDRASLSPSSAKIKFRRLDSSVEESGPHDFAVRERRVRLARRRVHRPPLPTFRDDRDTPLP